LPNCYYFKALVWAQFWQDFNRVNAVKRLGDILNTAPEPKFNPARAALPAIRGDVTFDHVMFRHRIDGPEVTLKVSHCLLLAPIPSKNDRYGYNRHFGQINRFST